MTDDEARLYRLTTDEAYEVICGALGWAVVEGASHSPGDLRRALAALLAENAALREKHAELHRRAQAAEAAVADLLKCSDALASGRAWCGGNLGRAFLAHHNQKLLEENAELKAALKPFAALGTEFEPFNCDGYRDTCPPLNTGELTMGDLRRAAELLKGG